MLPLMVPDRPGRYPSGVCVYISLGSAIHGLCWIVLRKYPVIRVEQQQAHRGGMWSTSSELLGLLGCSDCVWGANPLLEHGDFVSMPLGYTSGPYLVFLPSSPWSIHTLQVQLHPFTVHEGSVMIMWGHLDSRLVLIVEEERRADWELRGRFSRSVMNAVKPIMPDGDRFLCVKSHKWKCHHFTVFTANQQNCHIYWNNHCGWRQFKSTFGFYEGFITFILWTNKKNIK